jgi:protein involved in polysaccharide export with SLBB domain
MKSLRKNAAHPGFSGSARRLLSFALIVGVATLNLPRVARAEPEILPGIPGNDLPRTATGTTGIPIQAPTSTEVLQEPERRVLPPMEEKAPALEGPIDPDQYICGRGDVFDINVWARQNFKLRVTADMEGVVFIPKVGAVRIDGKTLTAARADLRKAIFRYYPQVNVEVSLGAMRSLLVHLVGFVHKPGVYASTPLERVSALVARAGVVPGASSRRIRIRRRDGNVLTADLVLYDQTGDVANNPKVMDGDVVDVPAEGLSVTIAGPVHREGKFELINTKDMTELLAVAGGLKPSATRKLPIRVLRRDAVSERVETVLVPFPAGGELPNLALRPDDRVYIPDTSELQRSIVLVGAFTAAANADEATAMKRLPFVEGDTVRSVLDRGGEIGPAGDLSGAYILRANGSLVHVDLERLLVHRDFSADCPIELGDTLVVPFKRRSVLVQGAVMRPGAVQFNPQFGISEYVASAGGPNRFASSASDYKHITQSGKILANGANLTIQPGDTIVVPERTFSRAEITQLVMGGAALVVSSIALVLTAVKR